MNKREEKLLAIFRRLPETEAGSLLDFAEFLASRLPEIQPTPLAEPQAIQRPEQETVIAAVKRLSATYPMLNKDKMLRETADLVAQNLLQGREAVEVIDELELVFLRHYETSPTD